MIFTSVSDLVWVLLVVEGPTVGSGGAGSTGRSGSSGRGERLVLGRSGRDEGERDEERGFEFPGPGPGLRDFDLPFALSADQPHGGVQNAVAQRLGFGVGEGVVEAEQP